MNTNKLLSSIEKITPSFSLLPYGFYVYHIKTEQILYTNDNCNKLFELPKGEKNLTINRLFTRCHPDDISAIRNYHAAVQFHKFGDLKRIEFRLKKSSSYNWVRGSFMPLLREENDQISVLAGMFKKIDLEKRYFDSLKKELKRMMQGNLSPVHQQNNQRFLSLNSLELISETIASLQNTQNLVFNNKLKASYRRL